MKQQNVIARVVCRKTDAKAFKKAGFAASPDTAGSGTVHLVHADSEKALSVVMELFSKFIPFTARLGRTGPMGHTLIASDGMTVVVIQVASSKDWVPDTETPRDYHSPSGRRLIIRHLSRSEDGKISSDVRREYRRVRTAFARLAAASEVSA
jgi:hypothetical protein